MQSAPTLLAVFSPIDYGIVAFCLAAMLAVGCYFARGQNDPNNYCLAGRSLGWLPLGLSQAAFLAAALALGGLIPAAYEVGLKTWIIPASFWLILPIVLFLVIPIYRGLRLTSIFEYLEYRFDVRLRRMASTLFLIWRLAWLVVLFSLGCQAIAMACGEAIPDWAIVVAMGTFATAYTALGGQRAVVWIGVMQCGLMLAGMGVVVVAIWLSLSGGPTRVSWIAENLGRRTTSQSEIFWSDPWTIWAALPHWLVASLVFCTADQIPAQRFLAAQDINTARTSYFITSLTLTFLLGGLIYIGVCLLAFYSDRPEALAPEWVVNVDGQSRQLVLDDRGRPLLDSKNPAHRITPETIEQLVAERRILRPNDKLPFTNADELIDPLSGQVAVEKLAMFRPGLIREAILRQGAVAELLPRFVSTRLGWGGAGIAVAALIAAAAAIVGAGLNSIATLLVVDFNNPRSPRFLTIAVGIVITVVSLLVALFSVSFEAAVAIGNSIGATFLAVILLGMLTRHATAAAAIVALVLGVCLAIGLSTAYQLGHLAVAEIWFTVVCFAATLVAGFLLSFLIGRRKTNRELRGLVLGCGTLGIRSTEEIVPIIPAPRQLAD